VTPSKTSIGHASATTPTRYAEAGGVKFAFRELGTPGGIPVVLLHPFTATIDGWDPRVLDGLAAVSPIPKQCSDTELLLNPQQE
jgi:hypothetical protein